MGCLVKRDGGVFKIGFSISYASAITVTSPNINPFLFENRFKVDLQVMVSKIICFPILAGIVDLW